MKSNFSKLSFLFAVIFLAASSSLFAFLYIKIKDNTTQSAKYLTDWQKESKAREELVTLDRSIKMIEGDKVALETHFVHSSDILPFLNMIEKRARDAGVKSEVLSVNQSEDEAGLFAEINASGNFQAIYKFLTLLENSPFELQFNSVDMQKAGGGGTDDKTVSLPQWTALFHVKLVSFIE